MQELNQAGNFRGSMTSYGFRELDSGAKCLSIICAVHDVWDPDAKEWVDWREYGFEVGGDLWLIKKDGSLNESQIKALTQYAGWDGNLIPIVEGTWQPLPIGFTVKADHYNNQERYRIVWINDYNRQPGATSNIDADRAKALQAQYGSQFRALAGNANRNTATPAGKPKAPQPPKRPSKPAFPDPNAMPHTSGDSPDVPWDQ